MSTAREIALALAGRRAQPLTGGWLVPCPVPTHGRGRGDRNPSLSVHDGDERLLVHCFAGCDARDVLAELVRRGLLDGIGGPPRVYSRAGRGPPEPNDSRPSAPALALWHAALPARGTLAEVYLGSRGLSLPAPDALRFHGGLKHPSGGIWPAMVALVARGSDGAPLSIHRTFLARDGSGKVPVDPEKMMLGPCRGGAVRLGPARSDTWLVLAEGIEKRFVPPIELGGKWRTTWARLSATTRVA